MVKTDRIAALAKNLLMPLLLVGVVVLAAVGYSYYQSAQHIVPQYSKHLSGSARKHAESISDYLVQQEKNSALLAQSPEITKMIAGFSETKDGKVPKEFASFIKEQADFFGYKNLLLIDTKGDVLFALAQEKLLGINLYDRPYNKSELARSFFRVMMSMTSDVSSYAFDPIINQPALYLSIPLFKDNSLFGILAAQLDQEKLITPLQNYLGLGKTGEIILGKRTPLGTQIIMPTRNDPDSAFKKALRLRPDKPFALQKAVRGNTGVIKGIDYRNEEVIAAMRYLPNIDLGLVAKIDTAEIFKAVTPIRNLFFGILGLVLGLLLLTFLFSPVLIAIKLRIKHFFQTYILTKSALQKIVLGLSGLSLLATMLVYYNVQKTESRALDAAKVLAQSLVDEGVDTLNRSLSSISQLAKTTAEDLNAGRLLKEDIITSIKRDMNENEELFGMLVAFSPSQDTQASQYIVRTEKAFEVEQLTGYATNKDAKPWYKEPMKTNKGIWLKPQLDPSGKKLVVLYSIPFYAQDDEGKTTPLGVVAALYAIDSMQEGASLLHIGQTGYSFVITQDGTFIYHPVKRYIAEGTTIFSLAEKQGVS